MADPEVKMAVITLPRLLVTAVGCIIILSIPYRSEIKQQWDESGRITDWLSTAKAQNEQDFNLAKELLTLLEAHSPAVSGKPQPLDAVKDAKAEPWPTEKDVDLMDALGIKPQQIVDMREAHRGFINAIVDKIPRYISPSNQALSQGIVTVGGSSYFPPLMVSLRLLRRTGTTLPVEVFLPEEEYEPELCEQVMPTLNASCHTFSDLNGKISHYQFKIFALLLSSFSDVLWLDADNFPLHDAAPLFTAIPLQSTGLVTWPDLWQTSISPAYYLISSQSSTPVSARASTESGQLLVSKAKHWKTLLLTAYYNYYGPDYYYPLLCQGGAGCGDKETFLPAAGAMGLPFYDVKTQPRAVGHYKLNSRPDLGINRFALIQSDPSEDYKVTMELEREAENPAIYGGSEAHNTTESSVKDSNPPSYENVPPLFLHMSTPKWDAFHVFDHVGGYDLTQDKGRNPAPAYRDPPEAADKIKGIERMVLEETRWVACNLEDVIGYWEGKRGSICQRMEDYFRDVLDTEEGAKLGLAADLVPAPHIP
ncbi:Alpha-1,2-mannosyltransferase MNN2 [Cytospora mali]|uniref:Alpha-1,2-mannosyltransferase MNN2 n=1 Tax=Cytospora mali TaxID=578113 RepID=A0A194W1D5_CYTMA|nr:Alpha-1,2-mannosyltransferase MNN2 [Valsa mali]